MKNNNLLIIGAGAYGAVVSEIATEMHCFEKIDLVDDNRLIADNGQKVVGTTKELDELSKEYGNIVVAIGNPQVRLSLLDTIETKSKFQIVSIISPMAYISPSAKIEKGSIIEPMSVIHSGCIISRGSIISAGAVVNHFSTCCEVSHIDCNATVEGGCIVPIGTKVCSNEVYKFKKA